MLPEAVEKRVRDGAKVIAWLRFELSRPDKATSPLAFEVWSREWTAVQEAFRLTPSTPRSMPLKSTDEEPRDAIDVLDNRPAATLLKLVP